MHRDIKIVVCSPNTLNYPQYTDDSPSYIRMYPQASAMMMIFYFGPRFLTFLSWSLTFPCLWKISFSSQMIMEP